MCSEWTPMTEWLSRTDEDRTGKHGLFGDSALALEARQIECRLEHLTDVQCFQGKVHVKHSLDAIL
jgi:hypothetical protein